MSIPHYAIVRYTVYWFVIHWLQFSLILYRCSSRFALYLRLYINSVFLIHSASLFCLILLNNFVYDVENLGSFISVDVSFSCPYNTVLQVEPKYYTNKLMYPISTSGFVSKCSWLNSMYSMILVTFVVIF